MTCGEANDDQGSGSGVSANAGFRHTALLYDNREELLEGVGPFAQAAEERGEALLVALPSPTLAAVGEVIDAGSGLVSFMDLDQIGRNPARLVSAWSDFAENDAAEATGLSCIGESAWFGRSDAEIAECERHEQALNRAFAGRQNVTFLCPYDRGRLSEEVIERVGHSHPELTVDGSPARASDTFVAPQDDDPFGGELDPAGGAPEGIAFEKEDLADLRAELARRAAEAGLDRTRRDDLVLAGDELATNSIRYGGGGGSMRIWSDAGLIHCEVSDEGRITDPMVGRVRPAADQIGGRGLWLANQLCDLVQIRSGPDGSRVRLSMATT
jgi:anti-sigma regulatory factor (Ser/Thr protein kinase)